MADQSNTGSQTQGRPRPRHTPGHPAAPQGAAAPGAVPTEPFAPPSGPASTPSAGLTPGSYGGPAAGVATPAVPMPVSVLGAPTEPRAIWALVLSLTAWPLTFMLLLGPLTALPAAGLAIMARRSIIRSQGTLSGLGKTTFALASGAANIVVTLVLLALALAVLR